MKFRSPAVLATLGLFLVGCAHRANDVELDNAPGAARTALDEYVHTPDPSYEWELVKTIPGEGYTGYVLDMVSQNWLTEEVVNRTEWRHWVVVAVPDTVKHRTGFLYIGGGSNEGDAPGGVNPIVSTLATQTNSVVTELRMVPNQPLVFNGETRRRTEDALIAYTWDQYLRTGDPKWPARLPMTKSAVRAMDAVTEFCASDDAGALTVDRYVVAGGSKRGWTTWTTAAVDTRVVAIVPIVIDMLNIEPSFDHHYRAYGFYAPAVTDYKSQGVMEWQGRPEYSALMDIVEPYEYRSRYTMPKFLVNSAGDQFFIPDSSQFYFEDLPGEKYLRYVPNSDHGLGGTDALESVLAYYHSMLTNHPRPRFTWEHQYDGVVRVFTLDKPASVKLWQATNPKRRDFRKEAIGDAYTSTTLHDEGGGVYVAEVEAPETGYRAYFVELTFPNGGPAPFKFTTDVKVIPDKYPNGRYEPDTSYLPQRSWGGRRRIHETSRSDKGDMGGSRRGSRSSGH